MYSHQQTCLEICLTKYGRNSEKKWLNLCARAAFMFIRRKYCIWRGNIRPTRIYLFSAGWCCQHFTERQSKCYRFPCETQCGFSPFDTDNSIHFSNLFHIHFHLIFHHFFPVKNHRSKNTRKSNDRTGSWWYCDRSYYCDQSTICKVFNYLHRWCYFETCLPWIIAQRGRSGRTKRWSWYVQIISTGRHYLGANRKLWWKSVDLNKRG